MSLDTLTGRVSRSRVRGGEAAQFHGYADRVKGKVMAVYAEEGRLWLQFGKQRLDVTDGDFTFQWVRKGIFTNEFRVLRDNEALLHITYGSAARDPLNLLDPTFDGLDEELADLPLWLSRVYPDPAWRTNVLRKWQ